MDRPRQASAEEYAKAFDTLQHIMGLVEADAFQRRAPAVAAAVPVIIVSGFLGAGKTTLMRRLLTESDGLKITAIVNDLANMNIDAALVESATDDMIALGNGCVCCSAAGGAAQALLAAAARDPAPDMILLEASGVADPWGVAAAAGGVDAVDVSAVVTVLDATMPAPDAEVQLLLRRQLAAADIVLLNKMDEATPEQAERAAAQAAAEAPRAAILRTVHCDAPPEAIFDVRRSAPESPDDPHTPINDDRFKAAMLYAASPISRAALEQRLEALPAGIFRVKGFLSLADGGMELLQCVGRRWSWSPAPPGAEPGLAVIGLKTAMQPDALAEAFAGTGLCLSPSLMPPPRADALQRL